MLVRLLQLFECSMVDTTRLAFHWIVFKTFVETVTDSLAKSIDS